MKNAILIHPPCDSKYSNLVSGYRVNPPPVGLSIIASYCKLKCPDWNFRILDGNNPGYELPPISQLNLAGFTGWFTNHENILATARNIKRFNPECKIVIGGPNATNLNWKILKNNSCIDYVISGDGEIALEGILNERRLSGIPNIWYRDQTGEPCYSYSCGIDMNNLPEFDFSDVANLNLYKYNKKSSEYAVDDTFTPIPVSSIRGCHKALREGPCSYCSIPNKQVRMAEPNKFWRQAKLLYTKYGIVDLFETGDNFVIPQYMDGLLQTKPIDVNISLRIYSNLNELTDSNIEMLAKIGVKEVFIGLESFDNNILEMANKHNNYEMLDGVLNKLQKHNIFVFLPIIFGLPGESINSLTTAINQVKNTIEKHQNVRRMLISLALPLAGSSWFNTLVSDETVRKLYNEITNDNLFMTDNINYEVLFSISLICYSKVAYDSILNTLRKLRCLLPPDKMASFGGLEERIAHQHNNIIKTLKG